MNDLYRALIGRFVGAAVGAGTGYLAAKGVATLDPGASVQLTNAITGAVMLAGYSVAHQLTNRSVNPADAAKP